MRKWLLDLEDFEGKPAQSNEKALEAIQMAWYEEWTGEYDDEGPPHVAAGAVPRRARVSNSRSCRPR